MVVLMNAADIARFGFAEGQTVTLQTATSDNVARSVSGLRVVAYDIPAGCVGAYYPECNVLIPLEQHAQQAKVPAAKSVPVRLVADQEVAIVQAAE
jgi:anaerobic selenocysteine-containing dehydrogenase